MSSSQKFSPGIKHFALKYHLFRLTVQHKQVDILPIITNEQTAESFTKPLKDKYSNIFI